MGSAEVIGTTDPRFERVREVMAQRAAEDPGWSAQFCVYWRGEPVIDLAVGQVLGADDITGVFSVSKGIAGITLATLIRSGELDVDQTVAHYWPEFAAEGKEDITVRILLSHQAGLVGAEGLTPQELLDSAAGAARLAATRPQWRPGAAVGYHGITIGVFMEELVRRIAGTSLQRLYEETIRAPRGIDFYLGLPEDQDARYRPLSGPSGSPPWTPPGGPRAEDGLGALGSAQFNTPRESVVESALSPNLRAVRAAGPASFGGVGSARGLARAYSAALGHVGDPVLDRRTIELISQEQVWGTDRILQKQSAFGIVMMKSTPLTDLGSYRAFGHDGAGSAMAYADPLYDAAVGYIPNPMLFPTSDQHYRHLRTAATETILQASGDVADIVRSG